MNSKEWEYPETLYWEKEKTVFREEICLPEKKLHTIFITCQPVLKCETNAQTMMCQWKARKHFGGDCRDVFFLGSLFNLKTLKTDVGYSPAICVFPHNVATLPKLLFSAFLF